MSHDGRMRRGKTLLDKGLHGSEVDYYLEHSKPVKKTGGKKSKK